MIVPRGAHRRNSSTLKPFASFLTVALTAAALSAPVPAYAIGDADSLLRPLIPRLTQTGRQVTAFRDVNVVPMGMSEILHNQTVIVNAAQIVTIGPAEKTVIPSGATVIDGSGRYLIPGLMDMHFHMPEPDLEWDELQAYLAFMVANGITTVRSTIGGPSHPLVKQRVERGEILSPSLYLASPGVSSRATPEPETVRKKILQYRSDGFDCVKFFDFNDTTLFNAAVKACRESWLPCFGHVNRAIGFDRAVRSMRSIEHLDGLLTDAGVPEPTLATDVSAMRAAGVWSCPTQLFYEVGYGRDVYRLAQNEGVPMMPAALLNSWVTKQREEIKKREPEASRDSLEMGTRKAIIKNLYEGGVGILLGSDSPGKFRVPGYSLMEEMRAMQRVGLPPEAILVAATRNPAACIGLQNEVGTIEVGKRADMVLLEANPLDDIENLRRRAGVMLRGVWFTSEELDQVARKLATLLVP